MTEVSSGGAPAVPPPRGMSTGAKVLIGCLALALLAVLGVAAAAVVGGLALKRGVDSVTERVEEQRDASATLRRIEEDHPFEPPEDGVVGEERLDRFLAATDDAWEAIRPWAEDIEDLRESANSDRGGLSRLRDLAAGARAVGGFAQSRVALAEVLSDHDMSLAEYTWTGLSLSRAVAVRDGRRSEGSVPEANVELVRSQADRVPTFDDDDPEGAGAVLAVATLWGLSDLSTWQAMGLDTLMNR